MRAPSSSGIVIVLVAALVSTACGDPPDKEMQQAQSAIDAARAEGADQYSHEEFAAAIEALKRAHDAVEDRDYRLALNNALDSRERAENAAKLTADQKAVERLNAQRKLSALTTAMTTAQARLKAAEAAHGPARTVAAARRSLGDAERSVQEARTAFNKGDYAAATAAVSAATGPLFAATRDLESIPSPAARRGR